MALHQLIEKSTLYLEKANDALLDLPSIDLSILGQFIDMEEIDIIYNEVKKFIKEVIEEIKNIIENVVAAIRVMVQEITQLSSVQKFITLLFNTAKRIGTAFTEMEKVIGEGNSDASSLKSFVSGAEKANEFVEGIFSELPGKNLTDAFISQLEILKIRLINLNF